MKPTVRKKYRSIKRSGQWPRDVKLYFSDRTYQAAKAIAAHEQMRLSGYVEELIVNDYLARKAAGTLPPSALPAVVKSAKRHRVSPHNDRSGTRR